MPDLREYFQTRSPRCISTYASEPFDLNNLSFDGHAGDSVNTAFRVSCACGSRLHFLSAVMWRNPDSGENVAVDPIGTDCCGCGTKHQFFRLKTHGYEGELGLNSYLENKEGTAVTLECRHHPDRKMEVVVRFEYPADLIDGEFPDWRGREQELFTWFTVYGRCSTCSEIRTLAEFECA